jgi:hypothetical protein
MKDLGSGEEQRLEIRDRDWHTMYQGSRPRGGGSLHPASNLVYDHRCLHGAAVGGDLYLVYV